MTTKPNDMAKEAMAKAAAEYEKLASAVETEADLWRQVAGHMATGDLVSAFKFKSQALQLRADFNERAADRMVRFVEIAHEEFWKEAFSGIVDIMLQNELSKCDADAVRGLLRLHEMVHGTDRCQTYLQLRRRLEELGER